MLKFGFDIHGVLDDLPEVFVAMNGALYEAGHEIHILTGSRETQDIHQELAEIGIRYHKFFSITDYHESIGTKVWNDENGEPWLDNERWNRTKAEYCEREGIDLHFDDSSEYEPHFVTPFARIWTKNNRHGRGPKKRRTALEGR